MNSNFHLKALVPMVFSGMCCLSYAEANDLVEVIQELEQEKQITNIYQAYFPNNDIARKTLISFHAQLLESNLEGGFLILELSEAEKKQLAVFGYRFKPATDFIANRNQHLQGLQRSFEQTLNTNVSAQAIPGYSCYETVEETFVAAQAFVSAHPNLAQLIDVGDSWQKNQGQGGYDIQVLKLTNNNIGGDKPKLFVNSAIHAREYTTAPLSLEFARWLLDGYGNNADATWLLDAHEIHLMLHTNPDGRKKAESGLSWRKNTNQNYCGATSNSRGADLNRNFSFSWNSTNGQGSSGSACSDTYRGPSAGSEPEIQALQAYVRSIFPDKRGPNRDDAAPSDTSGIHIDLHSYSQLVLWPWGDTSQAAPNGNALQSLGRKFAYFNGYQPQQSIGLYPTDGTSDSVSYGELGVAAYTFELGTSFFQSCSVYQNTILPDNLPALIYAAKVVRSPYITPSGPDISGLTISGSSTNATIPIGGNGPIAGSSTDIRFSSANGTETTHIITAAEYYIDTPPWNVGAVAIPMNATDGVFNAKTEGVNGTIDATNLTQGQHVAYVRSKDTTNTWGAVSALFFEVTDDVIPDDGLLENAVTKSSINGAQGSETFYRLLVPAEATALEFVMAGGSGDADMYVRFAEKPTQSTWDCRPYKSGNQETCTISNAQAGVYHVMLRGYSAFSNTSLTGTYVVGTSGESFENATDVNIPDNNATGVTSTINVTRSGASNTVSVTVDIVHTYIGDLVVDLIAPDGTVSNLHNRSGGSANNINQTYSVNLGAVNSLGNWQLKVTDRAARDVGYIDRVKLTF